MDDIKPEPSAVLLFWALIGSGIILIFMGQLWASVPCTIAAIVIVLIENWRIEKKKRGE